MISEPLSQEIFTYSDLVTIIEMRDEAEVHPEILMEPITWDLYNKVVDLAYDPRRGKGHGNYVPALQKAAKLLEDNQSEEQALSILFLSDGKPSDGYALKNYTAKQN